MSDTIDSPQIIDPQSVSPYPTILRYGIIGGLIFVVYGLLANMLGLNSPSKGFGGIILNMVVSIALYIGLLVMAVKKHRNQDLGGFVSFGRAFLVAFLVAVLAAVISAVFQYFYATVIDPEYLDRMIVETEGMYERMGMSEELIETSMEKVKKSLTPAGFVQNTVIYGTIMSAIIALIIAAVMKKNPPEVL